jgi:hypothetical protein
MRIIAVTVACSRAIRFGRGGTACSHVGDWLMNSSKTDDPAADVLEQLDHLVRSHPSDTAGNAATTLFGVLLDRARRGLLCC